MLKVLLVIAEHGEVDATAVYLSRRVQFDIGGWSIFVFRFTKFVFRISEGHGIL